MSANRLDRLDAWRSICCLGVLWIHCWHLNASLPLMIFGINIAKPLSIVGNGVDFFFVISGFCMYYFYINKIDKPSFTVYKDFIMTRVYRILPAYAISLVAYTVFLRSDLNLYKMIGLVLANMIFLQNFSPSLEIWSHFWSIAVEWHFYLIFPIILYLNFNRKYFIKYFIVLTLIITLIGIYTLSLNKIYDLQLTVRFVEFAMGILMAYYYKSKPDFAKNRFYKIIVAFVCLIVGRLLNVDSILNYSSSSTYYAFIKVVGYSVMTSGFALLLFLTIDYKSKIFNFLEWKPLVFIGRISYSFYLWHGIVLYYVFNYFNFCNELGSVTSWLLQFCICIIITIPIAFLSYNFLEKNFKYTWTKSE